MAQKVQISFIDDIDGSAAEGTVQFGLDGASYEIDLSTTHAAALREALTKYVERAHKVGGSTRSSRGGRRAPAGGLNSTEVREWAKAQGIEIKDRGRVPTDVIARYKEATEK